MSTEQFGSFEQARATRGVEETGQEHQEEHTEALKQAGMEDFKPTKIEEIEDIDLKNYLEYVNKYSGGKVEVEAVEGSDEFMTRINMYPATNEAGITPSYEGRMPKDRLQHFLHKLDTIDYGEVGLRGLVGLWNLESNWETFLEERQGKYDQITDKVAGRLHNQWRAPRKIKEGEGHEPKWKDPGDEQFQKDWAAKLQPGEVNGNVRMTQEGKVEIDIANTDFSGLTPKWQKENMASAQVAVYEIMNLLNIEKIAKFEKRKRILPQSLDVSSESVHREWLKRNPYGQEDAIMKLPFHVMKQISEGRLDHLDVQQFMTRVAKQLKSAEEKKGSP